jgi:hypothetical protein
MLPQDHYDRSGCADGGLGRASPCRHASSDGPAHCKPPAKPCRPSTKSGQTHEHHDSGPGTPQAHERHRTMTDPTETTDHTGDPAGDRTHDTQPWTAERIRALGPVTDVATAARIFGLSRASAYDLARRGRFPVSVLRFGTRYRVPVAAILRALHVPVDDGRPDTSSSDAT